LGKGAANGCWLLCGDDDDDDDGKIGWLMFVVWVRLLHGPRSYFSVIWSDVSELCQFCLPKGLIQFYIG
jgi:hypothetical protein